MQKGWEGLKEHVKLRTYLREGPFNSAVPAGPYPVVTLPGMPNVASRGDFYLVGTTAFIGTRACVSASL